MAESIHDKLKRVRKPRVHITYDVETGGAEETKELPFVVGVMGDYSGDNVEDKKSLKERKFINLRSGPTICESTDTTPRLAKRLRPRCS